MTTDSAHQGSPTDLDIAALHARMVEQTVATCGQLGVTLPEPVVAALAKVPRHLFTFDVPLEQAYGKGSVVAKRDERGIMLSTVSSPTTIANMLTQAGDLDGAHVLEVGSGGYNASLLRELVGERGSVTTIDIDPDVVKRAQASLSAAGYDDVLVLQHDGELPLEERKNDFDLIIVTVGVWDIPPAWTEQLAEGGRLVLPLRTLGVTRSWALEPSEGHLVSRSHTMSGFVPVQGIGAHRGHGVPLDGGAGLWIDEETYPDTSALEGVLSAPRAQAWTGVTIGMGQPFHDLDLWLASHLDGFALLTAEQEAIDSGLINPSWRLGTPAMIDGSSLAYRARPRPLDEARTAVEFGAYGHGPQAASLAEKLAEHIRAWHERGRPRPALAVYPAAQPVHAEPGWFVLRKRHSTIVLTWP
ncbi:methyltransferase, FxLD system [Nonomuraea sp. NPDC059007]|uniref:methyltransferase, FxLD system n=1 Tax=Nonomuraea sp. NPDC059007 TaxID=3346692 RepID=UPI0036ACF778